MEKPEPERSTAADGLWNTNPDLHANEILDNIKIGATKSTAGGPSISYMLAPFAALLVKLSRDADVTASKTLRVTNRLYWLTWALLLLTAALLAKEGLEVYEKHYLGAEHGAQTKKQDKIEAPAPSAPSIPQNDSSDSGGIVPSPSKPASPQIED